MPRLICLDTYYPDFLKTLKISPASYDIELRKVLGLSFGTGDCYTRNLRNIGWATADVIVNCEPLQQLWAQENGNPSDVLAAQIESFNPDVIFLQDLSLQINKGDRLLAGQCSCPWPGDEAIRRMDIVFTSFPKYIPRIEALGVRAVYNPLAFEPSVLNGFISDAFERHFTDTRSQYRPGARVMPERIHDVVFIGGVGNPSHWRYGMEVLETVAREIPTFKWWGYGYSTLPANSALRRCYQGEAWGLDMYEILLQSKICLNRHGEVAEGYANNMRMFEATGCGALLLTEAAPNLVELFPYSEVVDYVSPEHAVKLIRHFLGAENDRAIVAQNGHHRTLRDHTYAQRMKTVSETLKEMLVNV